MPESDDLIHGRWCQSGTIRSHKILDAALGTNLHMVMIVHCPQSPPLLCLPLFPHPSLMVLYQSENGANLATHSSHVETLALQAARKDVS